MDYREGPIASVKEFSRIYDWKPPVHFIVCPTCEGRGTHVNPSIDSGGIEVEDFYEDPDFAEAYFGGAYDVSCHECGGQRVVEEPDEDAMSPEQLEQWLGYLNDVAEHRAEMASEMRWGY